MEQLSPENQTEKSGNNQTNLAKRSKESKEKRLKEAKDIVEKFNESEQAGFLLKFGLGVIFSAILYVLVYMVTSFIIFPYFDITLKALYAGLFTGVIGFIITLLIIVASTFWDHRDFALLSFLCPPIALFGVFSGKIRKVIGLYIIFYLGFLILAFASVMLLCMVQGITLNQQFILMKSNMVSKGSYADKIIDAIKDFFTYLFGLDDPKYKK